LNVAEFTRSRHLVIESALMRYSCNFWNRSLAGQTDAVIEPGVDRGAANDRDRTNAFV